MYSNATKYEVVAKVALVRPCTNWLMKTWLIFLLKYKIMNPHKALAAVTIIGFFRPNRCVQMIRTMIQNMAAYASIDAEKKKKLYLAVVVIVIILI